QGIGARRRIGARRLRSSPASAPGASKSLPRASNRKTNGRPVEGTPVFARRNRESPSPYPYPSPGAVRALYAILARQLLHRMTSAGGRGRFLRGGWVARPRAASTSRLYGFAAVF